MRLLLRDVEMGCSRAKRARMRVVCVPHPFFVRNRKLSG